MSKVSIFEKKWLDLVFEGKNKTYGAYKMRQESPKTTLIAFFMGLLFLGSVSGLGMLLSSFGEMPPTTETPPIDRIIPVIIEPETEIEKEKTKTTQTQSNPQTPLENHVPMVVAPTHEADPDVPKMPDNPNNGGTPGGTETGPATGEPGPPSTGTDPGPEAKGPEGPEMVTFLDKQPQFPGGMARFYAFVADNFDKSSIEDVSKITVYVSFVIEKNGTMTDIKVLRNPGYGMDKEAIRVLKSLRTKWEPGEKGGQKVRTQYTLPITFKAVE